MDTKSCIRFSLTDPSEVCSLANLVQTQVYWNHRFGIVVSDEEYSYKDFWDVCDTFVHDEGIDTVFVSDDRNSVLFIKESK